MVYSKQVRTVGVITNSGRELTLHCSGDLMRQAFILLIFADSLFHHFVAQDWLETTISCSPRNDQTFYWVTSSSNLIWNVLCGNRKEYNTNGSMKRGALKSDKKSDKMSQHHEKS